MELLVLKTPGSDMIYTFDNVTHHVVKLQAIAAKGLLMNNAVQSNGLFSPSCHDGTPSAVIPAKLFHSKPAQVNHTAGGISNQIKFYFHSPKSPFTNHLTGL